MGCKKVALAVLCGVICFVGSGCASVVCKGQKTININSKPEGVAFSIADKKGNVVDKATTPAKVTLKRGSGWFMAGDYTITFDGPEGKKTVPIKQDIEWGWYGLGNAFLWNVIGWAIVDPLTGAMYTLPDVNVDLAAPEPKKVGKENDSHIEGGIIAVLPSHPGRGYSSE